MVDGKWYLMDTTQCEAWGFVLGRHFLTSYERELSLDSSMKFKVANSSLADITFDNTEYDDPSVFAQYKDNYKSETLDSDFWN